MIPSEYGSAPTSVKSVAPGTRRPPAALVDLRPLEGAGEQLQLRELHELVDALEHREGPRRPRRARGEAQPFGVVFAYSKRPGVGDEADVERLRDLGRQLDAELAEHVAEDLGGGGGVRDDRLTLPKRVLSWWWSTSTTGRAVEDPGVRPSRLSLRSRPPRGRARRRRTAARGGSSSSMNRYSPGSGAWPERNMTASLPSPSKRERRGEQRAERVAVRGSRASTTRKRSCSRARRLACGRPIVAGSSAGRAHRSAWTF